MGRALTLQDLGMNTSEYVCRTNTSGLWQMTTPLCSTRFYTLEMLILVATLLSIITLWTICGNTLVLLALFRYKTLRTMSNCLIGNLAISDLLLALTVMPLSTGHDLLGYWVFGQTTCTLWLCIDVLYCTASVWGLCTVAFDRYLATVYPVWYHDQRSVNKAMACIVFVWIFSIIISIAPFIGWQHTISNFFTFNPQIRRYECILFTSSSYVLYSAIGSFVFPAILMTFLYIRIFIVLHNQSKGLKTITLTSNSLTKADIRTPIICVSDDDQVNGLTMDSTTTTLLSNAVESPGNSDDIEETGEKAETEFMLLINGNKSLDSSASRMRTLEGCREHAVTPRFKLAALPPGKRSNSFAMPSGAKPSKSAEASMLNIIDFERQNSHNVAIQRSTSDTECLNSNTQEYKLSNACNRSKSASALSSGEEDDKFLTPPIQRRSLPCTMSIFRRNSKMTTSMKRRFELREQRATKRMLLIMACFCVCWMPFLFMYVLRSVCCTCIMNKHVIAAIIWLGYANSSLNPILYTLFNDDFRNAFKKLLGYKSAVAKHGVRQ
ncbi:unnamed protein product [Candidula unifasciata]|uniref:G-protein coupled receptors family 1 profile domain-containing protein n=1 Tax=Candidula unifasciata TaxID=100452 RepID=A0A8S3Z871_9EUPU|nr:unnamed protein product [Candidula unifasciata]